MRKPVFDTLYEALLNVIESGSELAYDVAVFPLMRIGYSIIYNIPIVGPLAIKGIDIILDKLSEDWPDKFKGGKDEGGV